MWAVYRQGWQGRESGQGLGQVSIHHGPPPPAAPGGDGSDGGALAACLQRGWLVLRPAWQLLDGSVLAAHASTEQLSTGGGICTQASRLEGRQWHHVAAAGRQLRALQAVQAEKQGLLWVGS